MQLVLMHKNDPVATVITENNNLIVTEVTNRELMPVGTRVKEGLPSAMIFNGWNDNRTIPTARPGVFSLLDRYKVRSINMLMPQTALCSLTDCYWHKPFNSKTSWDDVSFFPQWI